MKRLLIACETLRNELELALENTNEKIEVAWMPNRLHERPERLNRALQEKINEVEADYDTLLFAYGKCGNGLVGLKSDKATMVIPQFEDCIAILLAHKCQLGQIRTNTYFLTPGWLKGEKSLEVEYQAIMAKYGEKKTKKIYEIMFKSYQKLMLIDTKAYQIEPWLDRVNQIGQILGLDVVIDDGNITILEKLLKGDWDHGFCLIPPGKMTTHDDFYQLASKEGVMA